jgi:DNA-binding transcriptional MerR regulator
VLRIGDLAARAGVSVDALRYYERRGLLRPTGRGASGYREYPPEAAALVRFIKRAQALGFTLAEVEELVRLRADARRPAAALAARDVAAAKVRDIDDRVRQLLALRGALAGLVEACEATCGPDGPRTTPAAPSSAPSTTRHPTRARPRPRPFPAWVSTTGSIPLRPKVTTMTNADRATAHTTDACCCDCPACTCGCDGGPCCGKCCCDG